jgi:hypothetical protein
MATNVINIANYRKRATRTKQCGPVVFVASFPMLLLMFCGFGWFVVPVIVPVFVEGETPV